MFFEKLFVGLKETSLSSDHFVSYKGSNQIKQFWKTNFLFVDLKLKGEANICSYKGIVSVNIISSDPP